MALAAGLFAKPFPNIFFQRKSLAASALRLSNSLRHRVKKLFSGDLVVDDVVDADLFHLNPSAFFESHIERHCAGKMFAGDDRVGDFSTMKLYDIGVPVVAFLGDGGFAFGKRVGIVGMFRAGDIVSVE